MREEKKICFVPNRFEQALAGAREHLPLISLRVAAVNGVESFAFGFWRGLRRLGFRGLGRRGRSTQGLEQRGFSPPKENARGGDIYHSPAFSPTNTLTTTNPKNSPGPKNSPKTLLQNQPPKPYDPKLHNLESLSKILAYKEPKFFLEKICPKKKRTTANVSR